MELQHIIKVEITKAETINLIDIDADLVRLIGVPQFTEIDIRKPAALVISTEKRDGVLVSDATLTFQTCERFLQKGEHYVFLATCADGTEEPASGFLVLAAAAGDSPVLQPGLHPRCVTVAYFSSCA